MISERDTDEYLAEILEILKQKLEAATNRHCSTQSIIAFC